MSARAAREHVDRLARSAYGRLLGRLSRHARDLQIAEDALGDALTRALEKWPQAGIPKNPEAWLITVARNRITDRARRGITASEGQTEVLLRQAEREATAEAATSWPLPDPRLNLLFACTHPAIPENIRAPLMLQTILGLTAKRIAPLFMISPAALGQRLGRAKAALSEAAPGLSVPDRQEWPDRQPAVLEAIYGAFSAGLDAQDQELAHEACFLSELSLGLMPEIPEAAGLHALCLYRLARLHPSGHEEFLPLEEQQSSTWDWPLIRRAEQVLNKVALRRQPGRYQLEAAIQSAHIHMHQTGENRWKDVIGLYAALAEISPSIGATVSHAGALIGGSRPTEALNKLHSIQEEASSYQPWWATYAAALSATGQIGEARAAYKQAIQLTDDPKLIRFLEKRRSSI